MTDLDRMSSAYRAAYEYLNELVEEEFGDGALPPPREEVAHHVELQASRLENRLLETTEAFMAWEYEPWVDCPSSAPLGGSASPADRPERRG